MIMSMSVADVATGLLVVLTSLYVGFQVGSRPSAAEKDNEDIQVDEPATAPPVVELQEELLQEDTAEDIADGDLSSVKAGWSEPCKLVLIVRTDLKLKAGDISTQCAKATLSCYKALSSRNPQLVRHWEVTGQAKIALKGKSEEQLLELEAIAKSLNLCARAVHDPELTKGSEGTRTVLAIGPAPVNLVNEVTGSLRLL